jgi:Xaa-Pro aminopeptidase
MHQPPAATLANRLSRVRAVLTDHSLDALLVTHGPNVQYLTNLQSSAAVALVTPDEVFVFADGRYTTAFADLLARGEGPPAGTLVGVDGSNSYDDTLGRWLGGRFPGRRVGFEAAHVTMKRHAAVTAAAGQAAREPGQDAAPVCLEPVEDVVEPVRAVKDEAEVAILRDAARRLSLVARQVLPEAVRPGRTELDLAAEIDHRMRQAGFERPAFDTIVASGPNSALPHAHPGERRLADGDLVLLDFGGVRDGYCVDLTRTTVVGQPSPALCALYRAVAEAQDAAIAVVRAGASAHDVDDAARAALARHGLAETFVHATGHGLGLEIHEAPRVGRAVAGGAPVMLAAGMVITIEPGAYVPGTGGVRLEDDVLVAADGAEWLTDVPRDDRLGSQLT